MPSRTWLSNVFCNLVLQFSFNFGGRIIDNRQIDNLTFLKIDSAISLSWSHELGNWHHGLVIFSNGEVGLSNSFILASWIRKLATWSCYLYRG